MQTYQVNFVHSGQRNSCGGFQGQTANQGSITVQANSSYQAQQQVQNMFGGHHILLLVPIGELLQLV